ncbi:MAG TPA: glutaminyl-peptide cyclotransferase [Longimicrobiales bacterium]|nr:glutaminyl-peptide cyclotransferase [Longimicrobiales bacterium]
MQGSFVRTSSSPQGPMSPRPSFVDELEPRTVVRVAVVMTPEGVRRTPSSTVSGTGTSARSSRERARLLCLALAAAAACGDSPSGPDGREPPEVLTPGTGLYTYRVVDAYPHDPEAFTQGLVLDDGVLFEGTGLRGRSSLRRVDLETGDVLQRRDLDPDLFGEGITAFGDRILQLTFTSNTAIAWDRTDFVQEGTFSYGGEGWGLTHDGTHLVMSDGTATLTFRDPDTFEIVRQIHVWADGAPVDRLNELEYVDGHVLANVWLTDRIAVIDPASGDVVSWLDLAGILPPEDRPGTDVLNGIAVDPDAGHLLVTGKLWPRLFRIELVPVE